MNNNDLNDLDKKNTTQEESEQFVWERLQNEALAAQRWRLEQEMEQAGENPATMSVTWRSWVEMTVWSNRFISAAVVLFVIASLAVTFFWI